MVDPYIEDARDSIREKVDAIFDRLDSYSDEVVQHMTAINNLCNDAADGLSDGDEDRLRDIIEQIQEITRDYI